MYISNRKKKRSIKLRIDLTVSYRSDSKNYLLSLSRENDFKISCFHHFLIHLLR